MRLEYICQTSLTCQSSTTWFRADGEAADRANLLQFFSNNLIYQTHHKIWCMSVDKRYIFFVAELRECSLLQGASTQVKGQLAPAASPLSECMSITDKSAANVVLLIASSTGLLYVGIRHSIAGVCGREQKCRTLSAGSDADRATRPS